jgi:hypothetical protein
MWENADARGRLKMQASGWVSTKGEVFSFITTDSRKEPNILIMPDQEQEDRTRSMRTAQLKLISR